MADANQGSSANNLEGHDIDATDHTREGQKRRLTLTRSESTPGRGAISMWLKESAATTGQPLRLRSKVDRSRLNHVHLW